MQQQPTAQSLPLVRLRTLGPFVFERLTMQEDHEPTYIPMTTREVQSRGKAITMLKILLCQRRRRATRDKLIDLLWTEDEQQQMKGVRDSLKVTAGTLREVLRVGGKESLLLTITTTDELMIDPLVWVDADAFEALVQQAAHVPNTADALPLWERAYALAQGEFLEDEPYSEWATPRRDALHGKIGQCTITLADLYTAHNRLDLAQEILWDAATAEYASEDALCRLLLLLERQERYHDAWNLYKNTKRDFVAYERKLTPRLRELGKRLREKLEGIEPYTVTSRTTNIVVPTPLVSAGSEVFDFFSQPVSNAPLFQNCFFQNNSSSTYNPFLEQQENVWLTQGASYSGQLLAEGWSLDEVLDSLRVVLQAVQGMPIITRRKLLMLGANTMIQSIPILTGKTVSQEELSRLHNALGESIADAWELFHSVGNVQVLAVGQALLYVVQQNHSLIFPRVRSMYYSAIYNLIGSALHFQEQYNDALDAHLNAHIAAMSTGDSWYVSQSLICQADSYQALKQYSKAIEVVEEALNILENSTVQEHVRLKAHALACWADNAMMMGDHLTAQKMLEASAVYLDQIDSKEEFDRTSWLQLAGKNALMVGDYTTAIHHFEEALSYLPKLLRSAGILIPLAMAYARANERDASIRVAKRLIPVISTMDAPMLNGYFVEYVKQDLQGTFPQDQEVLAFVKDAKHQLPMFNGLFN